VSCVHYWVFSGEEEEMTTYNPDTLYFRLVCQIEDAKIRMLSSVRYYLMWAADAKNYAMPQIAELSERELVVLCHLGERAKIDQHNSSKGHYFEENLLQSLESIGWRVLEPPKFIQMN
jgi:hypothetical protein